MAAAKIHNIAAGLHFGQRPNSHPHGPSVSGGLSTTPKLLSAPPKPAFSTPRQPLAFSDDSSESSSLNDDGSPASQRWPKNAMQILRSRMRDAESPVTTTKKLSPDSAATSIWERTKKTLGAQESSSAGNKRHSKRHRSLEAKTARYYAKRQQTGWTPQLGRKGSTSSSDDDGGFKMRREMSPRRKRGSREGSSTGSRDPSVAPPAVTTVQPVSSPRMARPDRADLPPSSTGVTRRSPAVALKPEPVGRDFLPVTVPAIRISMEDGTSTPSVSSYAAPSASRRTTSEALTIEEWISTRPLSKSGNMAASTQSLASSSQRAGPYSAVSFDKVRPSLTRPLSHAQSHMEISSLHQSPTSQLSGGSRVALPVRSPSHANLSTQYIAPASAPAPEISKSAHTEKPVGSHIQVNGLSSLSSPWNQPMSRYSLPAGIDERGLGFSAKPEPPSPESVSNKRHFFEQLRKKSVDSGTSEPPPRSAPVAPVPVGRRETARHALALSSAKSTEFLPIGGHVAADSKLLHQALQTTSAAAKLLNEMRGAAPSQSGRAGADEPAGSAVRWNSDWQLHQSSSGTYRPVGSMYDPTRLSVPGRSRLAPLKESDQKELEQALEDLDEFYESISTKSEDATLKSSAGLRSDSGVSSPRQVPTAADLADITKRSRQEKDRQEYTKQWIHQGTADGSSRRSESVRRRDLGEKPQADRKRGQSLGENNYDRRPIGSAPAPTRGLPPSDDLAYPYTPTVFTGAQLEFPNYPGTKRPQPHPEMDDLSLRKLLHSQNTPSYRVTTDLAKQLPSSRTDYAVPVEPAGKGSRDDAAFRQLRGDQKVVKDRPQTLTLATAEKPVTKARSISNSIKNLAKQFEGQKEDVKIALKSGVGVVLPSKHIMHAAVQINGQKLAARSSPYSSTRSIPAGKDATGPVPARKVSPKVSPMDDKQMDDLLLSLNSLSSAQLKKPADGGSPQRRPFSPSQKKTEGSSTVAKIFGFPSRTNTAMAV